MRLRREAILSFTAPFDKLRMLDFDIVTIWVAISESQKSLPGLEWIPNQVRDDVVIAICETI